MPDTPTQTHRTLPLLSEIIAFPLYCMAACLHVISVPFGIEPALAMLVTGSLFGLFLVPIAMVWSVLYLLESSGIWPGAVSIFLTWIGLPFAVCYTVQILVLDKLHLEVKHASLIRPRNRIERASNAFFSSAIDYFPLTCIPWSDDASLSPSQQYVFGVHPHGIHCVPLIMFTTPGGPFDKRFPGLIGSSLTGLAATVMFKLPLIREIFIHMGYVDASRPVANKVLESGRSLFVCTGGEEESMVTSMGTDIVVLKKRKGFVRLALAHGAALVPVFGVGNSDTYKVSRRSCWGHPSLDDRNSCMLMSARDTSAPISRAFASLRTL